MNSDIKTSNPMNDYDTVTAQNTHDILRRYMLVDGFDLVLDLKNSSSEKIVDARTGESYLDFFTFFASSPIGLNHPGMLDKEVTDELLSAVINKPSNSDIYTVEMADFVNTFARVAKPDYMKHLFFVAGGALAVENGLKAAFDWKVRKNLKKGYKEEKGHQVIHFRQAFHGRSGYTMSLTNTDPNKVKYYPKFNWPRITNPGIIHPLEDNLEEVIKLEQTAIDEIYKAIKNNKDDIAVIIVEPIQAEGGDIFFRKEFLQKLREIADENEIMLMFDEVQTGFGITGKFWASEHYVKPDIISFGKKAQICGIMVSDRIDEIEDNVFRKSSRINSTWGGDLTDMVRSKHILKIIEQDNLVENAAQKGKYLLDNLLKLQKEFPAMISGARGLGLLCSFNLPTSAIRDKFRDLCYKEKLIILGCGERTIRFRPALNVSKDAIDEGLKIIRKVLFLLSSKN